MSPSASCRTSASAFVTDESGLQVYDATRHVLSAKAKRMLKNYGADRCVEAFHMHHIRGEGGSTVGIMLGVRTNTADDLIDAGRELDAVEGRALSLAASARTAGATFPVRQPTHHRSNTMRQHISIRVPSMTCAVELAALIEERAEREDDGVVACVVEQDWLTGATRLIVKGARASFVDDAIREFEYEGNYTISREAP